MTDSARKITTVVIKSRPTADEPVTFTHQRNNPRSPWNHGPMCDTFAARKSYSAYRQNGRAKRGQA